MFGHSTETKAKNSESSSILSTESINYGTHTETVIGLQEPSLESPQTEPSLIESTETDALFDAQGSHQVINAAAVPTKAKNSGYNWGYLLPGCSTVAAATAIVATKHLLDNLAPTPAILIARKVLDTAYPGAFAHLTGVGTAIGIDVIACLKNGPWYYKEGHNEIHVDLLPDNSSSLTWGIIWGIHASWKLSAIFAVAESVPSIVFTSLGSALPFTYLGFGLLGLAGAGMLGAHLYSEYDRYKMKKEHGAGLDADLAYWFNTTEIESQNPNGDKIDLKRIPKENRLGWWNSGAMTGFTYRYCGFFAAPVTLAATALAGTLDYYNVIKLK